MFNIKISGEYIKLDSFLKFSGALMSGGEAKVVISAGLVRLNGEPCLMRGKKIYPGDTVSYDGENYLCEADGQ